MQMIMQHDDHVRIVLAKTSLDGSETGNMAKRGCIQRRGRHPCENQELDKIGITSVPVAILSNILFCHAIDAGANKASSDRFKKSRSADKSIARSN